MSTDHSFIESHVTCQYSFRMKFSVSPRLLDHFGVAMYNTVQKAIAELCANAYDADATVVDITYAEDEIVIADNGEGMTPEDLEGKYLRIGRDRRSAKNSTGETTSQGRPIIGNKGIGKLAGFGIAQKMTIETWKKGKRTTLLLDRDAIDSVSNLESFDISPKIETLPPRTKSGSKVRLTQFLEGVTEIEDTELRSYLARHLPSQGNWKIVVNGVECSPEAIPGQRVSINDKIPGFGKVTGFYVIADSKRDLHAGFAIRIRDRIVQEASLFGLNQQTHGFFNLTRIVGELNPDFIDPVENSTIPHQTRRNKFVINTSRSGFNPEDPAVQILEQYAREKLESIANGLAARRSTERKNAAKRRHPELENRLRNLEPDVYAKLDQTLDAFIAKLSKNEKDETVDEIVDLIIRYYESDTLRIILEAIRDAAPNEVARLSKLLAQYGAARVGEVAGMLHSQLEVIELLRTKVAEGVLEKEIHKIVSDNVWLLRSDLQYWFDNKSFATVLKEKLTVQLKYAEKRRPDLVCFDNSPLQIDHSSSQKKLVIVEFKKPGVEVGMQEIMQVMSYKKVFMKALSGYDEDNVEIVVLGDRFSPDFDRKGLSKSYRILSYQELLAEAKNRYLNLYESLAPDGIPASERG